VDPVLANPQSSAEIGSLTSSKDRISDYVISRFKFINTLVQQVNIDLEAFLTSIDSFIKLPSDRSYVLGQFINLDRVNFTSCYKLRLEQERRGTMESHDLTRKENDIGDGIVESAKNEDVPYIRSMIVAAFSKYIDRLGHPPGPMTADYNRLIELEILYVLRINGDVLGAVCLAQEGDSIMVTNLVVDPATQGRGYGRVLINYAERMAISKGLAAVALYTNVKFVENIAFYTRIGFIDSGRLTGDGFVRVYFRKNIA
jgi:GNAT superfamily N-acetyltransferase